MMRWVLLLLALAGAARADEVAEPLALAAREVVLAHLRTGDDKVDRIAGEGLAGLSRVLTLRTAIEPAPPALVDPERDELALYPLIYWPITDSQLPPSPEAYARLNRYLRAGGTLLLDSRDAGLGGMRADALARLAAPLDVPPLAPVPEDHVLTRAFYLLPGFPGRWNPPAGLWAEAALVEETAEGQPFRQLNDGVSPVLIGGNDWAAAWAMDARGRPLYAVGRGSAGERQREMAYRFGVNLVMYLLTGNYKSDQVHVPALLERLEN